MPIEVAVRVEDVAKKTSDYIKSRAEEIMNEFPEVEHVHVGLDKENRFFDTHIFVQAKHHVRIEGRGEDENINTSIESAVEKVEKQLRKLRDKAHDHKIVMKHVEKERLQTENKE